MNGLSATFLFMLFVAGVIESQPCAWRGYRICGIKENLGLLTHVEKGRGKGRATKKNLPVFKWSYARPEGLTEMESLLASYTAVECGV